MIGKRELAGGIEKAQAHLLSLQHSDGYWAGELDADASVTAGYVPLIYFLKGTVDENRAARMAASVLRRQRDEGSWSIYQGGPGDINVSVQAYFSLKLSGVSVSSTALRKAKDFILRAGGVEKTNLFTKLWLAIFGQVDWRAIPVIPPEILLVPARSPFSVYNLASWARTTIIALSIISVCHPLRKAPETLGVRELYADGSDKTGAMPPLLPDAPYPVRQTAATINAILKLFERSPVKPLRRAALQKSERWIIDHQGQDGTWGGIALPHVYSLVALTCLGHGMESAVMVKGLSGLDGLLVDGDGETRLQPASSPVWDTAWSIMALYESGLTRSHESLQTAARWLLDREVRTSGEWRVKSPDAEPGCWSFGFCNEWYPDVDDTAEVARALLRVAFADPSEEKRRLGAIRRGAEWICGMQSLNGGWAAFDRVGNHRLTRLLPFTDFMPPQDPTCPDVTAHAVELLGECGGRERALSRALEFLRAAQNPDGAWSGRWGVNFIYGTGMALSAFQAAADAGYEAIRTKGNEWLVDRQLSDGSWGESCATYWDARLSASGPGTASQTAWALMGLAGNNERSLTAAHKGLASLLRTQRPDGAWEEAAFTGAGFPRTFYLRYDLYRVYFPLLALSKWRRRYETFGTS